MNTAVAVEGTAISNIGLYYGCRVLVAAKQLRLEIFGSFALTSAEGQRIVISSKKSRALLATLALSPRGERSRAWLQDLLWSRVERQEAQNSLRRELSNLRASLGMHEQLLLVTDHNTVRLELCFFEIVAAPGGDAGSLLEGIDLSGEEPFEDWLRLQRSMKSNSVAKVDGVTPDHRNGVLSRPVVGVVPAIVRNDDVSLSIEAAILVDRFVEDLSESGLVDIVDYRLDDQRFGHREAPATGPDVFLSIGLSRMGQIRTISLRVTRTGSGIVVLFRRLSMSAAQSASGLELSVFVREAVDQLLRELALGHDWLQHPRHVAGRQAFRAIDQMFSLSYSDVVQAENNLSQACEISPQSTTFAWRAYRSVFLFDEPGTIALSALRDNIREFEIKALELNPYNGLTLSLLAHVHSFVLRDFETASDYVSRAKALNSDHIMMHDAEAMLNFYLGRLLEARKSAERADMLARHLPYRYCFATSLCMIDAMLGNIDQAIRNGERALRLQPSSAKKSYPPALRYLGASYAAAGRYDAAANLFAELAKIDPLADSRNISVARYPTPSEQAANFIRQGLIAVGR